MRDNTMLIRHWLYTLMLINWPINWLYRKLRNRDSKMLLESWDTKLLNYKLIRYWDFRIPRYCMCKDTKISSYTSKDTKEGWFPILWSKILRVHIGYTGSYTTREGWCPNQPWVTWDKRSLLITYSSALGQWSLQETVPITCWLASTHLESPRDSSEMLWLIYWCT